MKSNTTSKNNKGINTTTKALINPKCFQIYSNNHAFSALITTPNQLIASPQQFKRKTKKDLKSKLRKIKTKLTLFNESFKIASQKLHKTYNKQNN